MTMAHLLEWGKQNTTTCWKGYRGTGTLIHFLWECNKMHLLWKIILHFLIKLTNLIVLFLDIYPSEMKVKVDTKLRMWMFREALFIITSNGPHFSREEMKKLWHIRSKMCNSVLKRNKHTHTN